MSDVIFEAIDKLVENNTNSILEDFEGLKDFYDVERLWGREKTIYLAVKEEEKTIYIPVNITAEWIEGEEVEISWEINNKNLPSFDVYQKHNEAHLEIITKLTTQIAKEQNNLIGLWMQDCDYYAEKHNIDKKSFCDYFFLKYLTKLLPIF